MIKVTLVLLLAHAVIPRLRGRSAAERHALWAACLAAAATIPPLMLFGPAWQPEWAQRLADALPAGTLAVTQSPPTRYGDILVRATGVEPSGWAAVDVWSTVWVLGIVALWLKLGAQGLMLRRLMASARPITDARRLELAGGVARSFGLRLTPHLWSSDRVTIPIAWGIRRTHILLPAHQDAWADERLWAVLAHEMAHIRRRDWLTHLLAEQACAIYWFHPLMWLGRNRLRHEGEQAADDEVLGLGANAADYASHLLDIVRTAGRGASRATPTVAMARATDLEQRVLALLGGDANRAVVTQRRLALAIAIVTLVALPLAAIGARAGMTIELRTAVGAPAWDTAGLGLPGPTSDAVKRVRALPGTDVAEVTLPAVADYTTPPLYSDEARHRGIEGVVTVRADVDASGRVSQAQIVAGPGFGLDQNALVALRQWRFRPGVVGGVPTPMTVEIDVEFTLRNEAVNVLIANDMVSLVGPEVTPPRVVSAQELPQRGVDVRGTVVLDVIVLESGTPRIVRVLQTLGPDADEIATRTLGQWRFSPAMRDGQPIKVRMKAEVSFHG